MKTLARLLAVAVLFGATLLTTDAVEAHDHATFLWNGTQISQVGSTQYCGDGNGQASCSRAWSTSVSFSVSNTYGLSNGVYSATTGFSQSQSNSYTETYGIIVPAGKCGYQRIYRHRPYKKVKAYDFYWTVPWLSGTHNYKGQATVYKGAASLRQTIRTWSC